MMDTKCQSPHYAKPLILSFLLLCLAGTFSLAEAAPETRIWTNTSGKKIEGQLIAYDGTTVTLLVKGKKYTLPVKKLSQEDQEWLINRKKEKDLSVSSQIGLRKNVPISTRYGASTDAYFAGAGRQGKKLRKFYDTRVSICDDTGKGLFMKCDESIAWKDQTMLVYCPKTYKGDSTPIGVYINISPTDGAISMKPGYEQVMDKRNLIYASPTGTSNKRSDVRRMALVLDTLATLRKDYTVDEQRIFVGGVSGGGAMSAWMTVYFPEFRAALCQVRNEYIPNEKCFPTIEQKDVRRIARRKQAFAWITGPKDSNYQSILKSAPTWKNQHFVSKVFDVPGMKHEPASAKTLEEALIWAEKSSKPPKK